MRGGPTSASRVDELASVVASLKQEIESMRGERLRNDLASSLFLGILTGRITQDEARQLVGRGSRDEYTGTRSVVQTVDRLPAGRWGGAEREA